MFIVAWQSPSVECGWIRSRLVLEIASELVAGKDRGIRVAEVRCAISRANNHCSFLARTISAVFESPKAGSIWDRPTLPPR